MIFLFSGLLAVEPLPDRRADRHRGGGQQRRPGEEGLVPPRDPGPRRGGLGRVFFFFQVVRDGHLPGRPAARPRPGTSCPAAGGPVPTVVFASALAVFLASVNVYLRDTQHLVEVIVGAAWFWACPIVYSYQYRWRPSSRAPGSTWLYFLNPMMPLVHDLPAGPLQHAGIGHADHQAPAGHSGLQGPAPAAVAGLDLRLGRRHRARGLGRPVLSWPWSSSAGWPGNFAEEL